MPSKHKPGSIVRTKNGRYAKVLANGRWRFISSSAAGKSPSTKATASSGGKRRRGRPKKQQEIEE